MSVAKVKMYFDWKEWVEGLYLSWVKNVTNTILAYVGTNAADSMGLIKDIALNWRQMFAVLGVLSVVEIVKYINQKPLPDREEEKSDEVP